MSRAKVLLLKMGGKTYETLCPKNKTDADTGADIVEYKPYKKILAYIQPSGSQGSVKGINLQDSISGDTVNADFYMYHETELSLHDRLIYRNILYEIRAIEPWESSFMNFYKSYLVMVDGGQRQKR